MIARHALFSSGSNMSAYVDSPILEQHILLLSSTGCAVVLIVLVFVPHFELANFFKRLLQVATFILVFCMY